MVASVAKVRLLVVVMRSVKQTYRSDQEPAVRMTDSGGRGSAADGDLHSPVGDQHGQGREVRDHEVGVELVGLVRCGQGHGGHARGAAGLESGRGVLEDDAVGRVDAESAGGEEVGLGVGLAAGDVVGGDEGLGQDADGVEAGLGEAPRGRGDDGPALAGQRVEEVLRAGEQTDSPLGTSSTSSSSIRATASGTTSAGSRSAAISTAGRPCSSTLRNCSAVMPYSPAQRVQQRSTESREETRVPSLSNRRARAWIFMIPTLRCATGATASGRLARNRLAACLMP